MGRQPGGGVLAGRRAVPAQVGAGRQAGSADPRGLLVSGRFRVEFPERSVVLTERGDYVVFHGVDHSWFAEEESVILGIRWPSVPGYSTPG